ncbi:hypothetical protein EJ06DRAFT_518941 [Trichodelitschia bisporula]|uniref:Uncharacterized protein n=1 Tax=Trichodelitschia bisporula TaxID=703511 RepID=A0A6G1I918_9PEZI|nr:hypothetical protein EJ06DRAFT_518941 [Trichodelitschia bisporula]
MFLRAPSQQPPKQRRPSVSRCLSLTPSTVTPPSVSTHNSCATKHEGTSSASARATALLAKVASGPTTPRRGSRPSTPVHSPSSTRSIDECRFPAVPAPMERRYSDGYEVARCWTGHSQRNTDGYISFPDYEKYFQQYEEEAEREQLINDDIKCKITSSLRSSPLHIILSPKRKANRAIGDPAVRESSGLEVAVTSERSSHQLAAVPPR